ncbi:MAG: hypothetical protein LBQ24_05485 [Candidatus Peribacteria bacterium]|nr:hypothetical protein [Candidatus Peribacteria bacterium]
MSRCKEDFIKVMFLISEDEYILYFQDDKNYADFDIYTIKPFNNSKQQDLINSWLNNDIYDKKFDEIENKIDDITKNRIVSKFPFYLLTIIQSFDNYKIDLSLTSY